MSAIILHHSYLNQQNLFRFADMNEEIDTLKKSNSSLFKSTQRDEINIPKLQINLATAIMAEEPEGDHKRTYKWAQLDSLQIPRQQEMLMKHIQKSIRAEIISKQEHKHKKVLILYTSGCSGANLHIEVVKGLLKSKMAENQYLFDYKAHQLLQDKEFFITPEQQNGYRILYKVEQFEVITHSINVSMETIKQIANTIYKNYELYDSFMVLAGEDAICMISTILSFMLQNLSKLIIFTGGYFPITYMRNDIVNSLIDSFAVISLAQNFHDVVIVSKHKGYRANRSIKSREGNLGSVESPNLDPLVSINIKINFRENLFLPVPTEPFRIWTNLNARIGVLKFHIMLNEEALQYELNNPAYQGFVIQSYASNNLPDNSKMLNLFKRFAEQKQIIFLSVAQSSKKLNYSSKKQFLQQYHIYFGGDMTTEAACAKLSYLLSRNLSRKQIKKLIETNMRGQLTELKRDNQFSIENYSFMEIIDQSIDDFYPTKKFNSFITQIQDQLCRYVAKQFTPKEIQQIFKKTQIEDSSIGQKQYKNIMMKLINRNNLLHRAVKENNQSLYKYFLQFGADINKLDKDECSPLFYAVSLRDKKAIQCFHKIGANVICPTDELFQMLTEALLSDDWKFFQLLYHIEFKETLPSQTNIEGRNTLHLAALLDATKSKEYLLQKFKFNLKLVDVHGKTYLDYQKNN